MAEEGAVSGLEHELTRGKVGKFPVIAVIPVVAVLFLVVMYIRNKRQAAAAQANTQPGTQAQPDPNAVDPNTGLTYGSEAPAGWGLPSGPIGTWLSNNPTGPQYPVGTGNSGLPQPITNVQWSRLAFDDLTGKGNDPVAVGNALAKFLAGGNLTDAEQALVSLAEKDIGPPPEGLIPVNTPPSTPPPTPTPEPTPVPTPAPNPNAGWGHTEVKDGKNLNELLAFFGMTRQEFEAHNPGIQNTYRPYIAGIGYVPQGTPFAQTVLNVGRTPIDVWVKGGW